MVSNVMLGNSPTPQTGAPAGKSSVGSFAALLQPHEAAGSQASEANAKATTPDAQNGKKSGKSQLNQKQATAQQAELTVPVLPAPGTAIPQLPLSLADSHGASKEDGAAAPAGGSASASNRSGVAADTGNSSIKGAPAQELLAQILQGSANSAPTAAAPNASTKEAVQHSVSQNFAKLDGKQSKAEAKTAEPLAPEVNDPNAEKKLYSLAGINQTAKLQSADPAKENIQLPVVAKNTAENKRSTTDSKPPGISQVAKPQAADQEAAVLLLVAQNSGNKTTQAIESLATSAVTIALKQTIPAQSKLAAASLPSSSLNNKGLVSVTNAATRSMNNGASAHAAAPVHETSATHDQQKKQQPDAQPIVSGGNANQTQDQVNAVGRVLSSDASGPDQLRQGASSVPASPASPLKQDGPVENPATAPGTPVSLHSARLLESLGQSELRVGMKMGDLGNIEIRTQLHHDQVRAEISVERGDLSRSLAAEIPALQQKLHEQDMPLASIVINHQAAAGSGSFERGSQQQQQAHTPMAHVFGIDLPTTSFSPDEARNTESGLDIRI